MCWLEPFLWGHETPGVCRVTDRVQASGFTSDNVQSDVLNLAGGCAQKHIEERRLHFPPSIFQSVCIITHVLVIVGPLGSCSVETPPHVSNPIFHLTLSLPPLQSPHPFSSSALYICLTAVWNPGWHFKVLSVSWNQVYVSIRNRGWP